MGMKQMFYAVLKQALYSIAIAIAMVATPICWADQQSSLEAFRDKVAPPPLVSAYIYETSYYDTAFIEQALLSTLKQELGALPQGVSPRMQETPVGRFGSLFGSLSRSGFVVYANGHLKARIEGGERNQYASENNRYLAAYRLAEKLAIIGPAQACRIDEKNVGSSLLACEFVDLKFADIAQADGANRSVVYLNPRIAVGIDSSGREVFGSVRGAGIKVEFAATGELEFIEARPLRVNFQTRRSTTKLSSESDSLNRIGHLLRTTGFDPHQLTSLPAMPGYSVIPLPVDGKELPSREEVEHLYSQRSDFVEPMDPALPPPVLRPSYLFGMSAAPAPIEPKAVPFDEDRPQILAVVPSYRSEKLESFRVKLQKAEAADVKWHTINRDNKLDVVATGPTLDDPARFGEGMPVVLTITDRTLGFNSPVQAFVVWAPESLTTTSAVDALAQSFEGPRRCDAKADFLFKKIETASTDLKPLPVGEDLAEEWPLDHMAKADRDRFKNMYPGDWSRYRDNYLATSTVASVYDMKVDKTKTLTDGGSNGPIVDRQAGTHFAFSFDYKLVGSVAGEEEGEFQSDLCHSNPQNGAVVCHGGFGDAVLAGTEQTARDAIGAPKFFYVDQRYELILGEHRLGHIDARYSQDPVSRADGGPGPPGVTYGLRTFVEDWTPFIGWILFGVNVPGNIEAIESALSGWSLTAQLPNIRNRILLLGLSRPSVTTSVGVGYVPDPCLTLGDIKEFCDALGETRKPIIPGYDAGPYCTGPAAGPLSEADKAKPVVTYNHKYYSILEVKPAFPTSNVFVEENQDSFLPSVGRYSSVFMTNLAILVDLHGSQSNWNASQVVGEISLGFTGALVTASPNLRTGVVSARTANGLATDVWDNVHMKAINPAASSGTGAASIPGNIVVPGCSPVLQYWYAGVRVQLPEGVDLLTALLVPETFTIIINQILSWKYAWDPVPDCVHRHSNWSHSMTGSRGYFFDTGAYDRLMWAIVKADYNAGLPDYRPIQEAQKNEVVCTPSGQKKAFNPPYDHPPKEQAYSCMRTKLVEVGANRSGVFHRIPTFFSE